MSRPPLTLLLSGVRQAKLRSGSERVGSREPTSPGLLSLSRLCPLWGRVVGEGGRPCSQHTRSNTREKTRNRCEMVRKTSVKEEGVICRAKLYLTEMSWAYHVFPRPVFRTCTFFAPVRTNFESNFGSSLSLATTFFFGLPPTHCSLLLTDLLPPPLPPLSSFSPRTPRRKTNASHRKRYPELESPSRPPVLRESRTWRPTHTARNNTIAISS